MEARGLPWQRKQIAKALASVLQQGGAFTLEGVAQARYSELANLLYPTPFSSARQHATLGAFGEALAAAFRQGIRVDRRRRRSAYQSSS